MLELVNADRCPYCARARIVLADKGVDYETVEVDLSERPDWLYELNPTGRVPVIREGDFVLPESAVIMEWAEERWPDPVLLPRDADARAAARLQIHRFDDLAGPYYRLLFHGEDEARSDLDAQLARVDAVVARQLYLTGAEYGLADIAYVPWILRARDRLDVDLTAWPALADWVERLSQRPAIAAEVEIVAALAV